MLRMNVSVPIFLSIAVAVSVVVLVSNQLVLLNPLAESVKGVDGRKRRALVFHDKRMREPVYNYSTVVEPESTSTIESVATNVPSNVDHSTVATCADESSGTCCFPWNGANTDEWWLHRPEWLVSSENDTDFCFSRIHNETLVQFIRDLHDVQWHGNCSQIRNRCLVNSGYAMTFTYILKGWITHYQDRVPVQWGLKWSTSNWRFAAGVCEQSDLSCYFLPMSHCGAQRGHNHTSLVDAGKRRSVIAPHYEEWFLQQRLLMKHYFSRPQQWMRRYVYDFLKLNGPAPEIPGPCVTMHVRRTDVALEQGDRTYVPLQAYLEEGNVTEGSNIVLLTDDRSAIEEAHMYHANYNWMYLNRTRFKGSEGGFEGHLPSNDPLSEVAAIMSEMKMAAQCDSFVYSRSGFAELILDEMRFSGRHIETHFINMVADNGKGKFQKSADDFFQDVAKEMTGNAAVSELEEASEKAICENETSGRCCFSWDVETDSWWIDRPDWLLSSENDTHFCFDRIQNDSLREFIHELHRVQWHGNCSLMQHRLIVNTGYGTAVEPILNGWLSFFEQKIPFQWGLSWPSSIWIYASNAKTGTGVCDNNDFSCYFLPFSHCVVPRGAGVDQPLRNTRTKRDIVDRLYQDASFLPRRLSMKHYFTRPQQWLRRRLYEFMKANAPIIKTPCTAMHVRRTDVAVEAKKHGRTYFPLKDYLEVGNVTEGSNILLLTDDRSTIEEAHEYHPEFNWMYLTRARFKGVEGGFGNHFPSGDPLQEVLSIQAELKMAKQCDSFVHTKSNFADFIFDDMRFLDRPVTRIKIDDENKTHKKDPGEFFEEVRLMNRGTLNQVS